MNSLERMHQIHQMLSNCQFVSTQQFLDELQVSKATLKRDLRYMIDRLNAPIRWNREMGGYAFEKQATVGPRYEMPGLWFNESEIHALLMMQHLLVEVQPGLLASHLQPLQSKLQGMLASMNDAPEEIAKRVKIFAAGRRTHPVAFFEIMATATVRRHRLKITHFNRATGVQTERVVSPQQLVYYRDNWYLDGWCHLRQAVRSFGADAILKVELLADKAKEVSIKKMREELDIGYGIFGGTVVTWAKLRISPHKAQWVANEIWHPQQVARFADDGSFLLDVPYTDDRELVSHILSLLPEVEVLAPTSLRQRLLDVIDIAGRQFRS